MVSHLPVINRLIRIQDVAVLVGRVIALSCLMIFTTIGMKAFPEKRKELIQTLTSLINSIRRHKGCKRCEFCVSAEDENEFCLLGEWEHRKDVETYVESEGFKVLLGAMSLLNDQHDMKLYTDASRQESPGLEEALGIS